MTNKIFAIGDKVVALSNPMDDRGQPRIKGHVYIVEAIIYCSKCGTQSVNIGCKLPSNFTDIYQCNCGHEYHSSDRLWYTHSFHFAKITDLPEQLELAVASEDYESAALWRDLLNN